MGRKGLYQKIYKAVLRYCFVFVGANRSQPAAGNYIFAGSD